MSSSYRFECVERCLEIGRYVERQRRWVSSQEIRENFKLSPRQSLRYMEVVERAFHFVREPEEFGGRKMFHWKALR